MNLTFRNDLADVDWHRLKADLAADDFDNGRSPQQLEQSFLNSFAVCVVWEDGRIIGTARVLSDGICNAYLVDVWTRSDCRRNGIGRTMVEKLCERLSGQHLYLQTDDDSADFYREIGFVEQPTGVSRVIGTWLVNEPL